MSLRLNGITAGYGKLAIVRDLDLEVRSGTVTGLLGLLAPESAPVLVVPWAGMLGCLLIGYLNGVLGDRRPVPPPRPQRAGRRGDRQQVPVQVRVGGELRRHREEQRAPAGGRGEGEPVFDTCNPTCGASRGWLRDGISPLGGRYSPSTSSVVPPGMVFALRPCGLG